MMTTPELLVDSPVDLSQSLPADHRSGYIAVIGRPNVGKSTLLNRVLGQKIAIVSPKPQTTRDQLLGIVTQPDAQMLFLDTPGIHKPLHKLGEYMVNVAAETIRDVDVVLWLVDATAPPTEEDRAIADLLHTLHRQHPIRCLMLGLNKVDQIAPAARAQEHHRPHHEHEYQEVLAWYAASGSVLINTVFSGLTGEGVDALLATLRSQLPLGPRYYEEDEVTDLQTRFIVAELIREKALHLLGEEVPHSIAVEVDEFSERGDNMTYISAVIYVERETQKAIVLGKGGRTIKQIGQAARPEVEELVGTRVYLELWVKVWERWRKREEMLRRLGYALSTDR
jgi:GTP-binding protein Era